MGFFSKIFGGLTRTRENVGTKVDELVANMPLADDDFYEELTDILIMADVGVNTATDIVESIKARAKEEKVKEAPRVREMLKDELKRRMGEKRPPLKWPMVMLVVGVNGVGKTTTIGKLALRFKNAQHGVILAAADTFRAAAADQLQRRTRTRQAQSNARRDREAESSRRPESRPMPATPHKASSRSGGATADRHNLPCRH